MNQNETPLADALFKQSRSSFIPFDVPGHKDNVMELSNFFGDQCISLDKNSRYSIDNLCQPTGVIREAETLAAQTFGAHYAFFMVGGTTSSVQSMIMSACTHGDKIILPRNVHASAINAIILSGAIPIYVNPGIHDTLGISLGMPINEVKQAIAYNTDAKAIFVNNPTYYGICSNLVEIVKLAHKHNMLVLVDEAHGTHFHFHDQLPMSAMQCGADMSAVSMHKTGGSLTQSSMLLINNELDEEYIRSIINLSRTTSASYLLLASLDIARKKIALEGSSLLCQLLESVNNCRAMINTIGDYYSFADEIIDNSTIFDFDKTKLCINTSGLGLSGIETYTLLRDQYNIQLEFGDIKNVLAITSIGDKNENFELLIKGLQDIREKYKTDNAIPFNYEYITPIIKMSPAKAFYAMKKKTPVNKSKGHISGDYVMCYPPGIPLLAPGELITQDVIDHILYSSEKGCTITGLGTTAPKEINVIL